MKKINIIFVLGICSITASLEAIKFVNVAGQDLIVRIKNYENKMIRDPFLIPFSKRGEGEDLRRFLLDTGRFPINIKIWFAKDLPQGKPVHPADESTGVNIEWNPDEKILKDEVDVFEIKGTLPNELHIKYDPLKNIFSFDYHISPNLLPNKGLIKP